MNSVVMLRRLEKLEEVFAVGEPRDDWIDVMMWNGENGGVFGHVHCRFSKSRGETRLVPCSDAEEIAIMRRHYEDDGGRLYGRGAGVCFAEYLERFSYLGAEELAARRTLIVEQVRGNDGRRAEGSAC